MQSLLFLNRLVGNNITTLTKLENNIMNIINTTNEKETRQKVRLEKRVDRTAGPRLTSRLSDRIRSKTSYEGSSGGAYQSFGFYARF